MGLLARTLGSAGVDAISTRARSINFATRIADVSSTLMFLNDLRLGQAAEATNLGGGKQPPMQGFPRIPRSVSATRQLTRIFVSMGCKNGFGKRYPAARSGQLYSCLDDNSKCGLRPNNSRSHGRCGGRIGPQRPFAVRVIEETDVGQYIGRGQPTRMGRRMDAALRSIPCCW